MHNVIGHDWAVHWLRQTLVSDQVRHAYCILGPANVGKMTLALGFARALLCTASDAAARPCEACAACHKTAGGFHPDLRVIAPAADASAISVELIRDSVVREAALSPLTGQRKVFIIEQMHMATPAAANALLKTLEEPPAAVVILLLSERREALLPTIVSRCQVVSLRPLAQDLIEQHLRAQHGLSPAQAALLARLSNGRLGYAKLLAADRAALEQRSQQLDDLAGLLSAPRVERLAYAANLAAHGDQVAPTLHTWQSWWRDVWLYQQGAGARAVNVDRTADLAELARRVPLAQTRASLQMAVRTAQWLEGNVNVRLALDVLLLRLPHVSPN